LCDLARRFLLRRVTKLRLPIKVENRHAPAPLEDPGHLGQCKLGIWDVHQHALRANRVERICIVAEGLRIANRERHGPPTSLGSPARLVNHRPADVYPEYMAVPSDQLRNLENVGAHSATEVEDAFATTQPESFQDDRLARQDPRKFVPFIEKARE